ncbi:unnamed protein product, partial [Discosporangium mesarthrocarpum]
MCWCCGVHVQWERETMSDSVDHTGKEGFATVDFDVTVEHTRRVVSVTTGFAGAKNDKLIVEYESGIQTIKHDLMYLQLEYKLLHSKENKHTKKGTYVKVDGGCHNERTWYEFVFHACAGAVILGCCEKLISWVIVQIITMLPVPLSQRLR